MWIFRKKKEHLDLETLSEHLDGRLSADDSRRVELHLEACSECKQEFESLRSTVHLIRRVPEMSPRRSFTLDVAPSIEPARDGPRVPAWAYGAVASVAVLAFVAVLSADLGGLLEGDVSESRLATEQAIATEPQDKLDAAALPSTPTPQATLKPEIEETPAVESAVEAPEPEVLATPEPEALPPSVVEVTKEVVVTQETELRLEVVPEAGVTKEVAAAIQAPPREDGQVEAVTRVPTPQIEAVEDAAVVGADATGEVVASDVPKTDEPPEVTFVPPNPTIIDEKEPLPQPSPADVETGQISKAETLVPAEPSSQVLDAEGDTATAWRVVEIVFGILALVLVSAFIIVKRPFLKQARTWPGTFL